MTTWQTRAAILYLRVTRKRRYRTVDNGLRSLAHGLPAAPPPDDLRDRLSVEPLGDFEVTTVRPSGDPASSPGTLVYLHGGAFVNGINERHWDAVGHLADSTRRDVHVLRYGLAPRYGVDDATALLDALHHERLAPQAPLHLLGDSAGGNLALRTAQSYAGRGTIVGLTLIAPWIDLTMTNPAIDAIEPKDPWLTRAGMRPIAAQWAGDRDLTDPAVSPLFGDLDALPPTAVFVGTRDICLPDCRVLHERAPDRVELHVQQGSPHDYPLLPTPEGRHARHLIAAHVERTLASTDDGS